MLKEQEQTIYTINNRSEKTEVSYISLQGLANSFKEVEVQNTAGTIACADVIGKTLLQGRSWNYRKETEIPDEMKPWIGTTLTLLSTLSTEELYLLGIDNPSKAMRNAARVLSNKTRLEFLTTEKDILESTKLAGETVRFYQQLSNIAQEQIEKSDTFKTEIYELAELEFDRLNLDQKRKLLDQAVQNKISKMKKTIVYKNSDEGLEKEYDAYTLAINPIISRICEEVLSKGNYKTKKQEAQRILSLEIMEQITKSELIETFTEQVISEVSQEAAALSIRTSIASQKPSFIPWFKSESRNSQIDPNSIMQNAYATLPEQLSTIISQRVEKSLKIIQLKNNDIESEDIGLPEFKQEIPNDNEISELVNNVLKNRSTLLSKAEDWGLDPKYLAAQTTIAVGPFVSPSPISTTFAGSVENLRCSLEICQKIADQLRQNNLKGQPFLTVLLFMTEVPIKGSEAMDAFVVPKDKENNQKIPTIGKVKKEQSYRSIVLTPEDINIQKEKLTSAFRTYQERYPETIKQGNNILESILLDLDQAFNDTQNPNSGLAKYLDFAQRLNEIIFNKVNPSLDLPSALVDLNYYSPFIKEGIVDIVKFVQRIKEAGFDTRAGFVKIVDNSGITRILEISQITDDDVILIFRDNGATIPFSTLQKSNFQIAPCKALSYLLCFSNMVPVIYGSQNTGYYEPYARAKEIVSNLGLNPNLYRIQPKNPGGYEKIETVYDFYRQILTAERKN